MGETADIDAQMQAALARLTDNEKECLRRRLQQQTAKEMALELGVSPHAVEKRLKMARAKLGLSSSLEAARLLAASEEYQRTGPQATDLGATARAGQSRRHRQLLLGTLIVILSTTLALAMISQVAGGEGAPNPKPPGIAETPAAQTAQSGPNGRPIIWKPYDPNEEMVEATPTEMHMTITNTFSVLDADRSGFIEPHETLPTEKGEVIERVVYRRDGNGNVEPTGEVRRISREQAQADYIAMADENGDGRWDFAEYREWSKRNLTRNGIPAAWREDIERNYGLAD